MLVKRFAEEEAAEVKKSKLYRPAAKFVPAPQHASPASSAESKKAVSWHSAFYAAGRFRLRFIHSSGISPCLMNRCLKGRRKKRRRVIWSCSKRNLSCKWSEKYDQSPGNVCLTNMFMCVKKKKKKQNTRGARGKAQTEENWPWCRWRRGRVGRPGLATIGTIK